MEARGGKGLIQGQKVTPDVLGLQLQQGRQGLSLGLSDVFWTLVNKMAPKRPPPPFSLPARAGWKQSSA